MHPNSVLADEVGMIVCYLEVIDPDRIFKDFVLNLLYYYILAVEGIKHVSGTEI
jgi:hypothetical protein